ncbi:cytochrome P450 4C1-like [Microplitis mediator]|uniref:cytochrome P450 4C1-like n=1 Tax=Microplitis mediator TaxID=375433 RepID=UPI002556501B|nr:cytochrome P450 4C1-like [Microplitis mediator]
MELILLLLSLIILIIAVKKLVIYHYKRLDLYRAGNKIPGPPTLPIIGNAHHFFGEAEDIVNKVMLLLDNYPSSPARAWLGHKLCVVLFDPEQLKIVFHSPKTIEKDEMFRFFRPWLGTGLFTAPADKWKVHRKLIMPTFHPRILESFVDIMDKKSEIMVKVMEVELNKDEFDIFTYISLCTLDIICETAMGVTSNTQTTKDTSYLEALQKVKEIVYRRMFTIWLYPDIIFNLTKFSRDQDKYIKYLHKQTNDVIKQKRQQYSKEINYENNPGDTSQVQRKAFLDLLIELSNQGSELTNEELREEVDTIMFGGNDTTATVNSFVIYMLANFPEIQDKCYEELVEIYGDNINERREIKNEDLSRMEYLERVIKETMRLFPVGPLSIRHVSDDLNIGGGYTLPKSTTVVLATIKLHRHADIWEDPLRFNPDRFLPEQVAKRHPYAYVPFAAGSRNCIGMKYAMISMKILLATLLRNYIFMKDKHVKIEDIKIKADVTIKTFDPISVKIKRR